MRLPRSLLVTGIFAPAPYVLREEFSANIAPMVEYRPRRKSLKTQGKRGSGGGVAFPVVPPLCSAGGTPPASPARTARVSRSGEVLRPLWTHGVRRGPILRVAAVAGEGVGEESGGGRHPAPASARFPGAGVPGADTGFPSLGKKRISRPEPPPGVFMLGRDGGFCWNRLGVCTRWSLGQAVGRTDLAVGVCHFQTLLNAACLG